MLREHEAASAADRDEIEKGYQVYLQTQSESIEMKLKEAIAAKNAAEHELNERTEESKRMSLIVIESRMREEELLVRIAECELGVKGVSNDDFPEVVKELQNQVDLAKTQLKNEQLVRETLQHEIEKKSALQPDPTATALMLVIREMQGQLLEMKHDTKKDMAEVKENQKKQLADLASIAKNTSVALNRLGNLFNDDHNCPRLIMVAPSTDAVKSKFSLDPKDWLQDSALTLHILCAHDLTSAISFPIEKPKQWVKDNAAALRIGLKVILFVAKAGQVALKISTGLPLPIPDELISTLSDQLSSIDEAITTINGDVSVSTVLDKVDSIINSNDNETVDSSSQTEVKELAGAAFSKIRFFLEEKDPDFKLIKKKMTLVREEESKKAHWVKRENEDSWRLNKHSSGSGGSGSVGKTASRSQKSTCEEESVRSSSGTNSMTTFNKKDSAVGNIFKEGCLKKQGGGTTLFFGSKSWKRRYFVLKKTTMAYYEEQNGQRSQGAISKGVIPLAEVKIVVDRTNETAFGFNVVSKNTGEGLRTYYLQAETNSDFKEWMNAFREMELDVEGE